MQHENEENFYFSIAMTGGRANCTYLWIRASFGQINLNNLYGVIGVGNPHFWICH
jgi:hypothetical protein